MLRRRVEVLEAEVAAKPVVDVDAFAALEEDLKTATAVGEGLRVQVRLSLHLVMVLFLVMTTSFLSV